MTNIIIVTANGLIWPYVVIWASSQAKKESLSFLRMVRNVVWKGEFESFKDKKNKDLLQFQHSVVEWKKTERKRKSENEKDEQDASEKENDDSISNCIIQVNEMKPGHKKLSTKGIERKINISDDLQSNANQRNVRSKTENNNGLSTSSHLIVNDVSKNGQILRNINKDQLLDLSILIRQHASIDKRCQFFPLKRIESLIKT